MAEGRATALEKWLCENGGYLHNSISVSHSKDAGVHWRASMDIEPNTHVSTIPHSLALSYLNALVDDAYPVFNQRRHDFKIEAMGFFYLMAQYIDMDKSFWKPYFDTLPPPDSDFASPMWFDHEADLLWLQGTDVLHTMLGRRDIYEQYYHSGIRTLKRAGLDVAPYTWNLFRWAVTMFTSRSFSSRAIAPQDSKYWTTYKTNAHGQRQTVLLDMSRTPAEDLDFPVLFPVQDAPNHSHKAKVDWYFDPGRFGITIDEHIDAGAEVYNNYGPKSNDELLIGYGFSLPDNPNDGVLLSLKPPSTELQKELRRVQSGYFTPSGNWRSERAVFRLKRPAADSSSKSVSHALPEPLLELLLYTLRHERGLPFTFYESAVEYLTSDPSGRRYLPHIARMIVQFLAPKLQKLQSVSLPPAPANNKQRQALIYRSSQVTIIQDNIAVLRSFTRSLLKSPTAPGPRFVTLEGLLELWSHHTSAETVAPFIAGIEAVSGTADVDQLREAGWEDDVIVLLLCYIYLEASKQGRTQLGAIAEDFTPTTASPTSAAAGTHSWVLAMLPENIKPSAPDTEQQDQEALARAETIMPLVTTAASHVNAPGSLWSDGHWNTAFISELGGKMLQYESMTMMVPKPEGQGEEARVVIYVHSNE